MELKEGKKVDHPPVHHGSKDVTDAVAGAVYNCIKSTATVPSFGVAGGGGFGLTMSELEEIKKTSVQTADGTRLLFGRYSGKN